MQSFSLESAIMTKNYKYGVTRWNYYRFYVDVQSIWNICFVWHMLISLGGCFKK